MHTAKATKTVQEVLKFIVAQDYEGLLRLAPESRVGAAEIKKAIAEYHCCPVMPAAPIEELLDIVEIGGSRPKSWSVNLPLWTKEEGRSDLTLEMRFTESETAIYSVEIDDLHVL
jgi:hypothetical protein